MNEWEAAKTDYITNPTASYRSIAEKYGLPKTQVSNRGRDEKWRELREQYLAKTLQNTLAAVADRRKERALQVENVADALLNKLELAVEVCEPAQLIKNAKLVRALTGAIIDLKNIHGIKSDADRREQEARIAKLERETTATDNADTIEIVFDAGEDAWNE